MELVDKSAECGDYFLVLKPSDDDPLLEKKKKILEYKGFDPLGRIPLKKTSSANWLTTTLETLVQIARVVCSDEVELYFGEADADSSAWVCNPIIELEALHSILLVIDETLSRVSIANVTTTSVLHDLRIASISKIRKLEDKIDLATKIVTTNSCDKERRLLEWGVSNGVRTKLEVAYVEVAGRGALATEDLQVGDIAMEIPLSVIISVTYKKNTTHLLKRKNKTKNFIFFNPLKSQKTRSNSVCKPPLMDSDQRRKRKRLKPTFPIFSVSSVRSLLLFLAFISLLYISSHHISIYREVFRPVLVVSKIPLLTSPSRHLVRLFPDSIRTGFVIEDRVLFPDHVLLIVSKKGILGSELLLNCVYVGVNESSTSGFVKLRKKILSFDDFNSFQSIVRCPVPPPGYSMFANLEIESKIDKFLGEFGVANGTVVNSWDNLVYAAVIDEKTAVVFVKGLNLRPGRESDPNGFSCHFGFGKNRDTGDKYVITTRAITAAQEVVRCQLPRSVKTNPDKAKGMRVTVGSARGLIPSVAKIIDTRKEIRTNNKHELCVCTMVWNQASALREWVTYHSWLGVEKWFIYDNNSDDDIEKVVNELGLENYNVSRHVWPWIKTQEAGFSHCALRARDECNWVAFIDVDEYFYFNFRNQDFRNQELSIFPGRNSLQNLVLNFSSTNIVEIRTSCHSFGPSGLKSPPSKGVMIGYTCRLQSPERHKSIIRPELLDISLINVVHHFRAKKGFKYINLPQSAAVINHYKYQVWESFRAKFYRRVATYVSDWRENQNEGSRDRAPGLGTDAIEPLDWRLRFCEVWDTGLRDFVLAHLADPVTGSVPWEKN